MCSWDFFSDTLVNQSIMWTGSLKSENFDNLYKYSFFVMLHKIFYFFGLPIA